MSPAVALRTPTCCHKAPGGMASAQIMYLGVCASGWPGYAFNKWAVVHPLSLCQFGISLYVSRMNGRVSQ